MHTKPADDDDDDGDDHADVDEITHFFTKNSCRVHLFMTWISPADLFGERELFGLKSLLKSNTRSCLVILSNSLASSKLLQPLIKIGRFVFEQSPSTFLFNQIKNGSKNAGEIPLPQNLSNLIRLAALYKCGGVYLDTDFIILKDFSRLRNSIGAQSADANGNWTRLNNAVLVFYKNHELNYKFMEEFASTFDGIVWGHKSMINVVRERELRGISVEIGVNKCVAWMHATRIVED